MKWDATKKWEVTNGLLRVEGNLFGLSMLVGVLHDERDGDTWLQFVGAQCDVSYTMTPAEAYGVLAQAEALRRPK